MQTRLDIILETIVNVMEAKYDRGTKEDRKATADFLINQILKGEERREKVKDWLRKQREERRKNKNR